LNPRAPTMIGRYAIYDRIAAGGMATVHLGRLVGEKGFSRTVAIKRLHGHLAMDPDFVSMFLDEARLAARIRHPNVVQTLDVVVSDNEVFLVMDYVEGESLAQLMRIVVGRAETVPAGSASSLITGVLLGLHAAHEAKNDHGEPLGLVHRDVSPQNVLVDLDGVARVLDFGVAKALGQSHSTRDGQLKGKLAYMAPEQIKGGKVDRRTDVFAVSVVLWEALTGRRLFKAEGEAQVMHLVLHEPVQPPSAFVSGLPPALDAVVMRGLERDPNDRFATAEQMAHALEDAAPPMPPRKLAAWIRGLLGDNLAARARLVREIESASTGGRPDSNAPGSRSPVSSDPDGVDVTIEMDRALPSQPGSQASSISVEAPRRASIRPARSRTPLFIGGGLILCVGMIVGVVLMRSVQPASSATGPSETAIGAATTIPTSTATANPTTATSTSAPSTTATSTPPTTAAAPIPTEVPSPPSADAASTPTPARGVTSRPNTPTTHPIQPPPQPSAKLYSRF
jgi:eukaryotic-like serine/threonine-protein kinase